MVVHIVYDMAAHPSRPETKYTGFKSKAAATEFCRKETGKKYFKNVKFFDNWRALQIDQNSFTNQEHIKRVLGEERMVRQINRQIEGTLLYTTAALQKLNVEGISDKQAEELGLLCRRYGSLTIESVQVD